MPLSALAMAAGTLALVGAIVAVGLALSPRSRVQVRDVAERTGVGPTLAGALVLAFVLLVLAAFALAGTAPESLDRAFAPQSIVLAALLLAAGLAATGVGVAAGADYWLVARSTHRPAGALDAGETVAVEGTAAVEGEPPRTPFTGTPAVCYEARVLEDHGRYGGIQVAGRIADGGWRLEYAETGGRPFAIEDGTGRVAVDPVAVDRRLDRSAEVPVGTDDELPERVGDFLEANLAAVGYAGHDRRYVEAAVEPGDAAVVVGPARTVGATDASEEAGATPDRVPAGARVRVGGADGRTILATGTLAELRSALRRRAITRIGGGLLGSAAGYAWLLAAVGVL